MKNYLITFVEQVYEKYKMKNIPSKYTLDEIDNILKGKYKALEADLKTADIEGDAEMNAVRYYVINDIRILESLFTDIEKIELYNMVKTMEKESLNIESDIEKIWSEIQAGRRINIILESDDNKYISGFTLQGMSEKLYNELSIFQGIDSNECSIGNEQFHEYLKRLIIAEYL